MNFGGKVWGQLGGGGHDPFSLGPVEFKELERPLCGMSQQTTSGWCGEPDIIKQMQRLPFLQLF